MPTFPPEKYSRLPSLRHLLSVHNSFQPPATIDKCFSMNVSWVLTGPHEDGLAPITTIGGMAPKNR